MSQNCTVCGKALETERPNARTCSAACRQARRRKGPGRTIIPRAVALEAAPLPNPTWDRPTWSRAYAVRRRQIARAKREARWMEILRGGYERELPK